MMDNQGPRSAPRLRLHLVGDSTMIVQGRPPYPPSVGWGQRLHEVFDEDVAVFNHAKARRSSKSFIDEGRWDAVVAKLQPDDHLIVQFGRNDQLEEAPELFAPARGAFQDNLRRFVDDARDRGVRILLATPMPRRRFDAQGRFEDTMADYPAVVRELAESEALPLLDLHRRMVELYTAMGEVDSRALAWWLEPGVYPELPKGKRDNSHFSETGAREVCRIVAAELQRLGGPLAGHLRSSS